MLLKLTKQGINILKGLTYDDATKSYHSENKNEKDVNEVIDYIKENFGHTMSSIKFETIKSSILLLDKKENIDEFKSMYEKAKTSDDGCNIKDNFHTMSELYFHRMVLFSLVLKAFKENAWKSKLHQDGTMFEGYFIVGITTPDGDYTYHYDMKYWDMFDCKEIERAPEYDGHTPMDMYRLYSLF